MKDLHGQEQDLLGSRPLPPHQIQQNICLSKNDFQEWSIEDSNETYQFSNWSDGYFKIDSHGNLCVDVLQQGEKHYIKLNEVIQECKRDNLEFPLVLRFHDILRNQVKKLNLTFNQIIQEAGYQGEYFGVFPVKVNQMREVVEEIVDAGLEFNYGLEAGSKPELIAALANNNNPKSLTILNGYKDREYLKLSLLGKRLKKNIVVVIEKFSELVELVDLIQEEGMEEPPMIGLRGKLSTRSSGKWSDSSGDFAKFGLTAPDLLKCIKLLKENNLLGATKLLHFHVGSQIPDIRTIKDCITEGARIYCELKELGVPLEYFDVGGGIGVNYDGSQTATASSINYNLEEYIRDVIYITQEVCDEKKINHPHIVTESGRYITAHHSMIITDVFGHINLIDYNVNEFNFNNNDHSIVKNLKELYEDFNRTNFLETFHDIEVLKEEAIAAFKLGVISLVERAKIETLYWSLCQKIIQECENSEHVIPDEIKALIPKFSQKYLCNFSVFQSTADTWGIGQILPVAPLTRLNERPDINAQLADITCDSDGKIDAFLSKEGRSKTVKLHGLEKGEEYLIGIFLTGAYQDIMGDNHNLFGRVNEAHIYFDEEEDQNFYVEETIRGNKKSHVLSSVQYSPYELCKTIKQSLDRLIKNGEIRPREGVKLADFYDQSLFSYTYLTNSSNLNKSQNKKIQ
ncbi:biosynthetic arginine decarboxylase [Bacteriovoracaceae bacterium]|nr:biosynthetic arginine decarboxylase [Bacteriovoracaceae bacterium]